MLYFKYEAVDQNGNVKKGKIKAMSVDFAEGRIKSKGLIVNKLQEYAPSVFEKDVVLGKPKFSQVEMTAFCRQLATLCNAKIDIARAIEMLAQMASTPVAQTVLFEVLESLRRGRSFSDALREHPTVFSEMFVSMVRAGEASGKMDQMLNELADYYDRSLRIAGKIKGVFFYPVIVLLFAAVAITVLMIFVIPRFVSNFAQLGAELPLITKMVIGFSDWVRNDWYMVILVVAGLVAIPYVMKRYPKGVWALDWFFIKMPIFGPLVRQQAVLRFCTVFGTLFGAAVPITDTLRILSSVTGNELMNEVIRRSEDEVRIGRSVVAPYQQSPLYPQLLTQMMAIGEQSGTLETMLKKMTRFYEDEIERLVGRIQTSLEPVLIIFIALVVGVIVMSILMPQLQLIQNFQKQ